MYRSCVMLLLFVSYFEFNHGSGDGEHTVGHRTANTNQGQVRGNTYATLNTTVHVFWSIPFAEPPIGNLRFQRPVPKSAWSGVLDGTRSPNACYQTVNDTWKLNVPESEDCLYLNVFVPSTVTVFDENVSSSACDDVDLAKDLRPVMFYIYGGGFDSGASSIERYNASALAILNDVIVVTFNYRLGAFGFLYSGSDEAPGNAGIYDQLAALRWVHDNIRCFGGNPNDVTIFGNSAGSFSVGHLILSRLTRGLFQKAILMSGTPFVDVQKLNSLQNYEPFIKALSEATNCSDRPSLPEMTACLKLVPVADLNAAQKLHRRVIGIHFPVKDAELFDYLNSSSGGFEEAAQKNLSIIVGVVENEGALFIDRIMGNKSISNDVLHSAIDTFLSGWWYRHVDKSHQGLALHYLYTNWNDVDDEDANRRNLCDFMGDSIFVCASNEFAKQLSENGIDVYYYMFNERPSISSLPEWAGVTHADELHFVFGHPLDPNKGYKSEEAEASRRIIKIFGNFAKHGVPSFDGFDSWPRYTGKSNLYVQLNVNGQYKINKGPRASHCGLWNDLLIKLTEGC